MAVSKSSCQASTFVESEISQQALAGSAESIRRTQQANKRESSGRLIKLVAPRAEETDVTLAGPGATTGDTALYLPSERPISPRGGSVYPKLKRVSDVVGASLLLIGFSPLMVCVAGAIKLTSKGPVIFRQRRLTRGGKVFTILKFRTMRQDAEALTGAVWAAEKDPRITKLGQYLRTLRIDELPQLWNVLVGDMSLIGPRPERPEFASKLQEQLPSFNRRLEVKAGITGLAQVGSGYAADVESYRKKLALDRVYIKNHGLWMDLRIAVRTVIVMLSGHGSR